MNTYHVAVVWEMYGRYIIEANSIEEAKELALDINRPLPEESYYVDESIFVDDDATYKVER